MIPLRQDLPARSQPLCANIAGLGLHAGVALPARDRQRLERLCRYVARPAIAASRLSALDDGRLLYQLKRRWRDGTTHVVFEPIEFIAKLAALIPAPRVHLVRYHGVLAPGAPGRARIVPQPDDAEETAKSCAQKHNSTNAPTSKAERSTQTNLATTRQILLCLGLPARPPPIAPAPPEPQESLPFDFDEAAPLN